MLGDVERVKVMLSSKTKFPHAKDCERMIEFSEDSKAMESRTQS